MKLHRAILLILFCLSVLENEAQVPRLGKISLVVDQVPVHSVLNQIEHKTGCRFSYSSHLFTPDSLVSFSAQNEKVESIINELFDGRVNPKVIGRHVILQQKKKKKQQKPISKPNDKKEKIAPLLIKGIVKNGRTSEPIPQASVYNVYSRHSVLTSNDGQFTIEQGKHDDYAFLSVACRGFRDTMIQVPSTTEKVNAFLLPLPQKIETLELKKDVETLSQTPPDFISGIVPREHYKMAENMEMIFDRCLFQFSAVPSLGTNFSSAGIITNNISINMLAGYNGGVQGVEVGGLMNLINRNVVGVQIGGLSNWVGGKVIGVQVGGLMNTVKQDVSGIQIGGILNVNNSMVSGIQIGGIANYTKSNVKGIQVGGITNITNGTFSGLQVGGINNICTHKVTGVQVAGISNNNADSLTGLQLSGISNTIWRDLTGVQISGIFNHAQKNMKGLQLGLINNCTKNSGMQIGLINRADSSSGISIGLFNMVKNGYHAVELSLDELLQTSISAKWGAKHFYTIYQIGYMHSKNHELSAGFGFGSSIQLHKKWSINSDITSTYLYNEETFDEKFTYVNTLKCDLSYHITTKLEVSAGPSLNFEITDHEQIPLNPESEVAFRPFYETAENNLLLSSWIGFGVAMRYRIF